MRSILVACLFLCSCDDGSTNGYDWTDDDTDTNTEGESDCGEPTCGAIVNGLCLEFTGERLDYQDATDRCSDDCGHVITLSEWGQYTGGECSVPDEWKDFGTCPTCATDECQSMTSGVWTSTSPVSVPERKWIVSVGGEFGAALIAIGYVQEVVCVY